MDAIKGNNKLGEQGDHGPIGCQGVLKTEGVQRSITNEQRLKQLEQENDELKQFLTIQKKSTDLRVWCIDAAIKNNAGCSTEHQITEATKIFNYVTSQE